MGSKIFIIRIYLMIFVLFLLGCSNEKSEKPVPMSALLSNPERYEGQAVIVVGVLGRGADIYLTKEHLEVDDRSSSLLLDLEKSYRVKVASSSCRGSYVEISGAFGLVYIEGLSPHIGLSNVTYIKDKVTYKSCVEEM